MIALGFFFVSLPTVVCRRVLLLIGLFVFLWNNLDHMNEILLKVVLNTINGQIFLFWDFIFKFGSYIVFCVVLLCVFTFWVPCCVLWCLLRFPHGGDVQFVFVYSCL